MDAPTATLIAASIAAVVSILALAYNLHASRNAELRAAYRKTLEPFIVELGESLHQTVATSIILLKTKSKESAASWKEKGQIGKRQILALHPKMRYQLWGITDQICLLSRLPDWCSHALKFPVHAQSILENGRKLSVSLDHAIKNSYLLGRPPSLRERLVITFRAWKFRRAFEILHRDRNPNAKNS